MEAHDQILHGLLDMGQMLLLCGAEINRVEDTMTRLGRAYGAKKIDIFAITSDIVLTILFEDGVELTQTRRINKASSFDFVKLERLNALSRRICTEPVSAAEFRAELKKIDREKPKVQTLYLGSVVTALSFTLFFGGSWGRQHPCRLRRRDGLLHAAAGTARVPQRRVFPGAGRFCLGQLHLVRLAAGARRWTSIKFPSASLCCSFRARR